MTDARSSARTRPTAERTDDSPQTADGGSLRDAVRKAVLAGGVLAVAYFAARRFSSNGRARSPAAPVEIDASDGRRSTGQSADETPVGGGGETAGANDDASSTDASDAGAGASESEADPPEVEPGPPDEVIEERAEPDVETDPSEPGEMTVDDDLVEEVVEDDDSGGPAADE